MENLKMGLWLFLVYGFLGWILETVWCALKRRCFVNRGLLCGPLCSVYGISVLLMSVFLADLQGNWFFMVLGCGLTASMVELVCGKAMEHFGAGRWWNYSGSRFHLGGYICLEAGIAWGVLGAVCVTWINPFLVYVIRLLPEAITGILLIVFGIAYLADLILSVAAILGTKRKTPSPRNIGKLKKSLGERIAQRVILRVERAHPHAALCSNQKATSEFTKGCGYQKLFLLMVIGAFLGDVVETVFVWLTTGVVMSRSSLVWGQFSLVWGFALAGGTAMLYRYRDRSDGFLFWFGFFAGGVFEYFCSVFTELAFGTVFWDYSAFQFNLGGRINLLYCFFWGIAGVVWLKKLYPLFSDWIEKIPQRFGTLLVWGLSVFMIVNMVVTYAAMGRYTSRAKDQPPENMVESVIDWAFDDHWMETRYQNLIFVAPE
jgi:uncharacterized membrane protein